jgi:hypothetical protein
VPVWICRIDFVRQDRGLAKPRGAHWPIGSAHTVL